MDGLPAIWRELVNVDRRGVLDVSERLVDLLIIGHATSAEGFDHAVKTDLEDGVSSTTVNELGETTDHAVEIGVFVCFDDHCVYDRTRVDLAKDK